MKKIIKITDDKLNYAIIDSDNNIIQKFKLKATAINWTLKSQMKLNRNDKLKVIKIR